MKLVDDAKDCWRWTSMRGIALGTSIIVGWEALGDDLKSYLPHWFGVMVAVLVLVIMGGGGRVVKQERHDG